MTRPIGSCTGRKPSFTARMAMTGGEINRNLRRFCAAGNQKEAGPGAPHRGAAPLRRTSVFASGENLGAGGIHFRRAFSGKGWRRLSDAETKKKDILSDVLLFWSR